MPLIKQFDYLFRCAAFKLIACCNLKERCIIAKIIKGLFK